MYWGDKYRDEMGLPTSYTRIGRKNRKRVNTDANVRKDDMKRRRGQRRMRKQLSLDLDLALLEHEVLADHPLPDVLHVLDNSLEVRGRVVRTSDEDVVGFAAGRRGI